MKPLYSEQQNLLLGVVSEFARAELAPHASNVDESEEFPFSQFAGLAGLGVTGLTLDEAYGGAGGGYRDMMVVAEEVAAACGSTSTVFITHVSLVTTAIPDGDDFILNGSKVFCTNGAVADVFVVFANQDRSAGYRGINAIVVEKGAPGFTANPQHGNMGMRGSGTAELVFENCRVPRANLLGDEGSGYRTALAILNSSRIMIAAQCVGLGRSALEAAIEYAQHRESFGRPIASRQAIQFMLADMATELDAARLLTFRAASLYDAGMPHGAEASMAKLFASEAAGRIASKALQIHGGAGYFRPSAVERIYRDQRVTEIYEGTSEIQRIVISRALLGKSSD